tara:strand:+ start:168 stop:575 length:408 start_codon:yes stop_codon:yes gene_type:complete
MATAFPSITPTARSFIAPTWPTKTQAAQSGVITRRLWGSRPSQAKLGLTFGNINDTNTAAILNAYNAAKGSVDSLTLPTELFAGADAALQSLLDTSATGAGLLWCFAEGSSPQVESVAPGRFNVTVELTAELRMS